MEEITLGDKRLAFKPWSAHPHLSPQSPFPFLSQGGLDFTSEALSPATVMYCFAPPDLGQIKGVTENMNLNSEILRFKSSLSFLQEDNK